MMLSGPQVLLGRAHPGRHSVRLLFPVDREELLDLGADAAPGGSGMNSICCGVGCRQQWV